MRFVSISGNDSEDASAPNGPLEMLLGCHARIRHFMQLSRTLATAEGVPHKQIAEAANAIVRYFSQGLPLHEADENKSLFPRLRDSSPHGGLIREAAETMVEQHKVIDELVAELLPPCVFVGDRPERLPSVSWRLDHVTRALDKIFAAHLGLEETVVFPALAELLSREQIEEISREMRDRRRPSPGTIHLVQ